MNQRLGRVIILAIMLCLLCGCKQEVSNKFVENIKSSLDSEHINSSAQEIIGQVVSRKDNVIQINVLERAIGNKPGESRPEKNKPDEKPREKPDLELTKPPINSEKPLNQNFPDVMSDEIGKITPKMRKTGIKLEIKIEDTTECLRKGKTVSFEEIKENSVIYIEMLDNHAERIRVSSQSYHIVDGINGQ